MLTELHIEGFRCFQSLTAKPLGRVNLLVGKNNSGKTAFLDAVELLVADGPGLCLSSLFRRKEFVRRTVLDERIGASSTEQYVYPLSLFPSHRYEDGARCHIYAQDRGMALTCSRQATAVQDNFQQTITVGKTNAVPPQVLKLFNDGTLPVQSWNQDYEEWRSTVRFLPTMRAEQLILGLMWDEAQANDEDGQVLQTLRCIEPKVERLLARGEGEQRSFWVRLKGQKELVRLSSVGDGMRHLLALALYVSASANGYLLIDEIDLGLHHSVMAKMWRMLIESARRLNIQVFATTHSLDCINALAEVQKELNLTAEDLMLHRLEADLSQTISYTPEEIVDAAKYDAEVR